jgi:sulfoxide reductase catalytic subunit YedY
VIVRSPSDIRPSGITPKRVYLGRREVLKAVAAGGLLALAHPLTASPARTGTRLAYKRNATLSVAERMNSFEDVTSYNNFYELSTDKENLAERARALITAPWSVRIAGEADVRGVFALDDLIRPHPLEERIYRFRCVERWSMVVPWIGFPLGALIKRFGPTSRAKYVEFTTLFDPAQLPGQRIPILPWPYVEALRIDEAMHPLAILAVGLYGETLPNQNGAPLRLVVPWKYGFKSIKSIVQIRFTEKVPHTTWNRVLPGEYGFFANVNPNVDHPRWSQANERRLGANWLTARRPTLLFNGYADQVAHLYAGMDLARFF